MEKSKWEIHKMFVDSQWHLLQPPVGVPVQPGMCDVWLIKEQFA